MTRQRANQVQRAKPPQDTTVTACASAVYLCYTGSGGQKTIKLINHYRFINKSY